MVFMATCSKTVPKAYQSHYPYYFKFRINYHNSGLPKDWKSANLVFVHKKESKADVENYRPISLTSVVAKTFEHIIRNELMLIVEM